MGQVYKCQNNVCFKAQGNKNNKRIKIWRLLQNDISKITDTRTRKSTLKSLSICYTITMIVKRCKAFKSNVNNLPPPKSQYGANNYYRIKFFTVLPHNDFKNFKYIFAV